MIQIRELTEQEKKEAVSFFEWVAMLSYEEFEQRKKVNNWWVEYLLNWCRIRHNYPELNKIWEEKFVRPDREIKQSKKETEIVSQMSRNKAILVNEHLLDESQIKDIAYKIIHKYHTDTDESVMIAIPYTFWEWLFCKFWWSIEVYKSQCPKMYDEIIKNYWKYDWTPEFKSNKL